MDLNEMNGNWQKEAPTLAAMEKKNPFTVPEGYFHEMEMQLQSRINVSDFDNQVPLFTIPAGYFEELEDRILSITRLEQLNSGQETVLSIPENYFSALEGRIKEKLQQEPARATQPAIQRTLKSWTAYAAAACITAVISFGIYSNLKSDNNTIETQISALPTEEIVDYLQLYSDAGDALLIVENLEDESALSQLSPEISEQEIEQYLKLNL